MTRSQCSEGSPLVCIIVLYPPPPSTSPSRPCGSTRSLSEPATYSTLLSRLYCRPGYLCSPALSSLSLRKDTHGESLVKPLYFRSMVIFVYQRFCNLKLIGIVQNTLVCLNVLELLSLEHWLKRTRGEEDTAIVDILDSAGRCLYDAAIWRRTGLKQQCTWLYRLGCTVNFRSKKLPSFTAMYYLAAKYFI